MCASKGITPRHIFFHEDNALEKPLSLSHLPLELAKRHTEVISLILAAPHPADRPGRTYRDAGAKIDEAIFDLCALLYEGNNAPKLVCVEFFYHMLWFQIFEAVNRDFPRPDQLAYWRYNGFKPATEYMEYVRRRQAQEGRRIGAQNPGVDVLSSVFRFSDERRAIAPQKLVSAEQYKRAGFKIALCLRNGGFSKRVHYSALDLTD